MSDDGFIPVSAGSDGFIPISQDTPAAPTHAPSSSFLDTAKTMVKNPSLGVSALINAMDIARGGATWLPKKAVQGLGMASQLVGEGIKSGGNKIANNLLGTTGGEEFNPPTLISGKPATDPIQLAYSGLKGIYKTIGPDLRSGSSDGIQPSLVRGADAVKQAQENPNLGDIAAMAAAGFAVPEIANNAGPASLLEKAGKVAANVAYPDYGYLVRKGFAKGAEMARVPFLTAPEKPDITALADQENFPLAPSARTGSGTQSKIENMLSGLPGSSEVMKQKLEDPQLNYLRAQRDLLFASGQPTSDIEGKIATGEAEAIRNRVVQQSRNYMGQSRLNYGAISSQGSAVPENVHEIANKLLSQQMALEPSARDTGLIGILKDMSGQNFVDDYLQKNYGEALGMMNPAMRKQVADEALQQHTYDYKQLNGWWQKLNGIIKSNDAYTGTGAAFAGNPDSGMARILKGAVQSDTQALASQPGEEDLLRKYQAANAFHSEGKTLFKDNAMVRSIVKENDPLETLDALKKGLLRPNNEANIAAAKKVLGPDLYQRTIDHLIPSIVDKPTLGSEGVGAYALKRSLGQNVNPGDFNNFSPTQAIKTYENVGDKALSNLLGEERMGVLRKMVALGQSAVKNVQNTGTATTTGRTLGAMFVMLRPLYSALRGNWSQALAEGGSAAYGLPLAAETYMSKPVQAYLTQKAIPVAPAAGARLSALANPFLNAIQKSKQDIAQGKEPRLLGARQ